MIYGLESELTEEISSYQLAQIYKVQLCLLWMSNEQKNYRTKYECGCIIQPYVSITAIFQVGRQKKNKKESKFNIYNAQVHLEETWVFGLYNTRTISKDLLETGDCFFFFFN